MNDEVQEMMEMLAFSKPSTLTQMYAVLLIYKETPIQANLFQVFTDMGISSRKIQSFRNKQFTYREIEAIDLPGPMSRACLAR